MALIVPMLMGLMLAACEEDEYTSRGDLFQPRLIDDPTVEGNTLTMVWYEVNDAESYTVQLFYDYYYTKMHMQTTVDKSQIVIEDIPYATTYYIRIRSNASDTIHNSRWATTSATTEARGEYAKLLQDVSKTEITEESAIIRWTIDEANPVDSISVEPTLATTLPSVTRYLTDEEIAEGAAEITGLTKNTQYSVNIYDTSKTKNYDKPYNTVTFRTAGPSAESIEIGLLDDLSAILIANNSDSDIPDGTEYYLPAGSTYTITPFSIKKGFKLVGATGGTKPVVILNGTFNFYDGSYVESLEFQNVELQNGAANQYFMNCSSAYTLESASFVNVDFKNLMRGFWRHQAETYKTVNSIEFEGCSFDQCGWQTGCYGTFYFGSASKNTVGTFDDIGSLSFKNCTFSRGGYKENTSYGWGNLVYMPTCENPIDLTFKNVTIYDFCINNRMIDLTNATGSSLTIEGMLLASQCGDLYLLSNGTTSFSNNYYTTDYTLGGSKMEGIELGISAAELFADPDNGDYTITDTSSPVYINRAGDTQWIK